MGKAVIVSNSGEGAYIVRVEYCREQIDADIAFLQSRIIDLNREIEAEQEKKDAAQFAHDNAVVEMNTKIDALAAASTSGDADAIASAQAGASEATALAVETKAELQKAAGVTSTLIAARMEAQTRLNGLLAIPEDPEKLAYCADYSLGLSGAVGTIELPASEGDDVVTIRPDHPGSAAAYSAGTDGQLSHRAGMSPAQAFFNAAILPGWQRHAPLYRSGTLTAVDKVAHTGSVNLGATASSAQSLPVNEANTLSGVPIQYMTCDSEPFEIGDRVIVRFGGNWANPAVVGFEVFPRPCDGEFGGAGGGAGLAPSMSFHTDTALLKGNGLIVSLPGLCVSGCASPFSATSFQNMGPVCSVASDTSDTGWVMTGEQYVEFGTWLAPFSRSMSQSHTIEDLAYTATMDHFREIYLGGQPFLFKFEQTFSRSGTFTSSSDEGAVWSVTYNTSSRGGKYSWTRNSQSNRLITDTIETRMFVAPAGFDFIDLGIIHTMTSTVTFSTAAVSRRSYPNPETITLSWDYQRTFSLWERVYELSYDVIGVPQSRGGYEYTATGSYVYAYNDSYQPTTTHGPPPDPFFPAGTQISYTYERAPFGSPVTYGATVISDTVAQVMTSDYEPPRVIKPIVPDILSTMTGGPLGIGWF